MTRSPPTEESTDLPLEIETQHSQHVERARGLDVTDEASLAVATEFLRLVRALDHEIEGFFEPLKKRAWAAHKALVAAEKTKRDPLAAAIAIVKGRVGPYMEGQKRIAREAQERAEAEARQLAQEAQLARAAELEAQGATRAAAFILQQPLRVEVPAVVEPARPTGVSSRTVWKARVTNLHDLVRFVAANPGHLDLLAAVPSALNALAKDHGESLSIPGVEPYPDEVVTVR